MEKDSLRQFQTGRYVDANRYTKRKADEKISPFSPGCSLFRRYRRERGKNSLPPPVEPSPLLPVVSYPAFDAPQAVIF
jgi:hypothetical protein